MNDVFQRYMSEGFSEVEGWCSRDVCRLARMLAGMQKDAGIEGGAGEIGVHHGKFFIALSLLAKGPCLAIDLFGEQSLNVDRSGRGNLEQFQANFNRFNGQSELSVIANDSMQLKGSALLELESKRNPLALFSVDGCHTLEHTLNDMLIAQRLLGSGGIMFIDDYYNPNWPGVQEAVNRYYMSTAYSMVPLCFAFGKLVLVDLAFHAAFVRRLENRIRNVDLWRVKKVRRFGWDNFSILRRR